MAEEAWAKKQTKGISTFFQFFLDFKKQVFYTQFQSGDLLWQRKKKESLLWNAQKPAKRESHPPATPQQKTKKPIRKGLKRKNTIPF